MGLVSGGMLLGRCFFCVTLVMGLVSDGLLLDISYFVTLVMGLVYVGLCWFIKKLGLKTHSF